MIMQHSLIKLILFFILLFQCIFAEETEKVKVTLLRKGVQVILNGETITPKLDEELPLNSKIQSDEKGLLEFAYKGKIFRVNKNTTILVSDVINSGGDKNFQPHIKTSSDGGVRGLDKKKKKIFKKEN